MDAQATSTKTGSQDGSLKLTNREDLGSRFRMILIENLGSQPQAPAASGPNTKYHDVCVVCGVVWLVLWWCSRCGVSTQTTPSRVQDFRGCSPTSPPPDPPSPPTGPPSPPTDPLPPDRPKFRPFFSFSHHNFHCLGPYVEFWPKNSKRAHFRAPALQTPPNFNERSPKRERKTENVAGEEKKKKARNFGPPPCGAPPFGPHFFQVWAKNGLAKNGLAKNGQIWMAKNGLAKNGLSPSCPPVRGPDFWAPPYGPTLAKIGAKIGQQNTMAKNGLAKIGLAKVGHDRPEGVGPGRVGGPTFRAFFFTLPPHNSFFSSLSGGPLVELCLKRRGAKCARLGSLVVV